MGPVSTPSDPPSTPSAGSSPSPPTGPSPAEPAEALVSAQPAEAPVSVQRKKPTTTLGAGPRDMLISMLILLPIVGLLAFLGRGCSFSPGGPTVDPSATPTVDTRHALAAAAHQVAFPLRDPAVPPGWRANVVDQRKAPGDVDAVRVGWITAGGRYLRLVQTTAEEGTLVAAETGGPPSSAAPVQAAGRSWVDYTGANNEQAWAYRADGVEWLITGDGIVPEFQVLAAAVAEAPPLPTNG
jgi:hypothetical protein